MDLDNIAKMQRISLEVTRLQDRNRVLNEHLSAHRKGKLRVGVSVSKGFGSSYTSKAFQNKTQENYIKYCVDTIRDNEFKIQELMKGVRIESY